MPANQALTAHPEYTYHLVDTEKGLLILAADLQETCLARYALTGRTLASCAGTALEHISFMHPFYERLSPVYLGDYVIQNRDHPNFPEAMRLLRVEFNRRLIESKQP